jgi:hypothetical protein
VAVSKGALRILAVENIGETFNQVWGKRGELEWELRIQL